MRLHVELQTERNVAVGMNPDEARYAALRQFGNVASLQEQAREGRGWESVAQLLADLRYAARRLLVAPGFTIVAGLTLALGIGANTAIFSLFEAVVLRPLAVSKPQQLALLTPGAAAPGGSTGPHGMAYPLYRNLRDNNTVFDGLMCHFRLFANVGTGAETQRLTVELVSGNYFEVLGVEAALGRTLTADDDRQPGAHPVAVLSHECWQNLFAGDPAVLGRTIRFNGNPLTIVGVSAKGFTGVDLDYSPQVRVPLAMTGTLFPSMSWVGLENTTMRWVQAFGRLKPGVSLAQAQASLQPAYRAWVQAGLDSGAFGQVAESDRQAFLQSPLAVVSGARGTSFLRRDWSAPLQGMGAMAALLLLLTCVNVAGLLLGRGIARRGEIAVRLALGASRGRVVRQLLVESLLLVILGGAAGVCLAPMVMGGLAQLLPVTTDGPPNISPSLNGVILLVSLVVTAGVALLAGLVPALLATRVELVTDLKQASVRTLPRGRFRRALVVIQVCISALLLFVSGLAVRSLGNLYRATLGFETEQVVAFGIDPVLNGYPRARAESVYREIQERLAATPGIDAAAVGLVRLLGGTDVWKSVTGMDGLPPPANGDQSYACNAVSPDYFRTLRIAVREGRDFRPSDTADSPPVAIVNEAFVRQFLPEVEPLGRRLWLAGPDGGYRLGEIVGVVADSHYESVAGAGPVQVFVPYPQFFTSHGMNGYVRSALPVEQVAALVRNVVQSVDPALPIHAMRTLNAQRDHALGTERVVALLATAFGVLATLLAGVGLYGVLSYSVARRTPELGLRIALGGPVGGIAGLVAREVAGLCGLGLALAIPLAWGGSRLIAGQLHGVGPVDWRTALGVVLVVAVVAVLAAWLPARRATKIDPMVALRAE